LDLPHLLAVRFTSFTPANRAAKILRDKPVRPMNVPFRALVPRDERGKAIGFG